MSPAEFKIRYHLLIDISSGGSSTRSDQNLATLCSTTPAFVAIVLLAMVQDGEIDMASSEETRHITYRKDYRRRGTSRRTKTIM
jgi:hypothetical protein